MKQRNNKPVASVNRRRCLGIIGACAALPFIKGLPDLANAKSPASRLKKITWTGQALGADADITLYTDDEALARKTLERMLVEINRLEHYFSLFKENSLITKLNTQGELKNPPPQFFQLLTLALDISEKSNGRFDPSVQPLFMAIKSAARDRATGADDRSSGRPYESDERIIDARKLIGWRDIECSPDRIAFARPGMGLTLNGIAQGYITDRATDILKAEGFGHTLVNFGEYSALQPKPGKDGWNIQLGRAKENGIARPIWTLSGSALAASQKSGFVFDRGMDLHHMLDPRSGTSARHWREIYVEAPNATLADAASTALFATPPKDVDALFNKLKLTRALLIASNGQPILRD